MRIAWKLSVTSLAFGIAALLLPYSMRAFFPFFSVPFGFATLISLALMLLWGSRFLSALVQYKRRGLWFLLGLPLIAVAGWAFAVWWACAVHGNCYFL